MATLAESLRPTLSAARAIAGSLGLHPYSVSVVVTARSGAYGLEGTASATTVAIREAGGQSPKIRFLDDEERALGGLGNGAIEVGPITPDHVGGGITFATLTASAAAEQTVLHYLVTGPAFPAGQKFRLASSDAGSALHYTLKLEPIADA